MTTRTYLTILLVITVLLPGWAAGHYRSKAERWRMDYGLWIMDYGLWIMDYDATLRIARQQSATINLLQERQQLLTDLDQKHSKELADAKYQVDILQRDVVDGRKQLQLHVRGPAAVPAHNTPCTTRVDAAAGTRLTDTAERDYYTLRKRIETARQQIGGLQDYIRQQCLNGFADYWHEQHPAVLKNPDAAGVSSWQDEFAGMVYTLRNIDIINCSRSTSLTCIIRKGLETAIARSSWGRDPQPVGLSHRMA